MFGSWTEAVVGQATLFWSDERLQKEFKESNMNLWHGHTIQYRLKHTKSKMQGGVLKLLPWG